MLSLFRAVFLITILTLTITLNSGVNAGGKGKKVVDENYLNTIVDRHINEHGQAIQSQRTQQALGALHIKQGGSSSHYKTAKRESKEEVSSWSNGHGGYLERAERHFDRHPSNDAVVPKVREASRVARESHALNTFVHQPTTHKSRFWLAQTASTAKTRSKQFADKLG